MESVLNCLDCFHEFAGGNRHNQVSQSSPAPDYDFRLFVVAILVWELINALASKLAWPPVQEYQRTGGV